MPCCAEGLSMSLAERGRWLAHLSLARVPQLAKSGNGNEAAYQTYGTCGFLMGSFPAAGLFPRQKSQGHIPNTSWKQSKNKSRPSPKSKLPEPAMQALDSVPIEQQVLLIGELKGHAARLQWERRPNPCLAFFPPFFSPGSARLQQGAEKHFFF